MRADLEWFRTFKAIFDTGTMSDAAKELNISQPGVSLHLSSLENYIGHPLFERNTRKMIPNERARKLYRQICYSLTKLEEVENSVRKRSGKENDSLPWSIFGTIFSTNSSSYRRFRF
ncbi:LysR family transcriptional regulator [Bacteroides sp. CR5/BHMF/2]|nr:LysR family transcriptional regulator [Bacteroides sp. CR5/BHMF/2]